MQITDTDVGCDTCTWVNISTYPVQRVLIPIIDEDGSLLSCHMCVAQHVLQLRPGGVSVSVLTFRPAQVA